MLLLSLALAAHADPRLDALDAHLQDLTDGGRFSGHVLVAEGDDVVFDRTYGYADWSAREPFDDAPLFRIGSLTKQFTAAIVVDLADQGRLSLEDPLALHVPELRLERDGAPVRLTHLLHHTSGISELSGGSPWAVEEPTPHAVIARAADQLVVTRAPGSAFAYSNTGYMLLGEVIRRATGGTYEDALAAIVARAGLEDTVVHRTPDQERRLAAGHLWALRPVPSRRVLPGLIPADHTWEVGSDGAVTSSARDLLRWVQALREGRVLSRSAMDALLDPGLDDYAAGWVVRGRGASREVWHNGALSPLGYSSDLGWWPETGRTVIVLRNLDVQHTARGVYRQVEGLVDVGAAEPMAPRAPDMWSIVAILARFRVAGALALLVGATAVARALRPSGRGRAEALGAVALLIATATAFAALEGTVLAAGCAAVGIGLAAVVWRRGGPWFGDARERELVMAVLYALFAVGAGLMAAGAVAIRWMSA